MSQNSQSVIDWNEYAINYDSLLGLRPYEEMLAEVVTAVWSSSPNSILDAGCGTGNLLVKLATPLISKIVGMDSSTEMLIRAERKCPGVKFVQAELNNPLPFSEKMFDAVTCINALYAVEDPERTLAEFMRILSPGGMLVIVTPKEGYENGLILKAHCGSDKPDEYWKDMHSNPLREETLMWEALKDESLFQKMYKVAEVNRLISRKTEYHFLSALNLWELVRKVGFHISHYRTTYAHQSHLLVARRP